MKEMNGAEFFWVSGDEHAEDVRFDAIDHKLLTERKWYQIFFRTLDFGFLFRKITAKLLQFNSPNENMQMVLKELKKKIEKYESIKIKYGGKEYLFSSNLLWEILYMAPHIIVNDGYNTADHVRNKVVVDAGANIGVFSIFAAKNGAKAVHAFEPVNGTYDMLVENIKLNKLEGIVIPHLIALGKKDGEETIHYSRGGDLDASIVIQKNLPLKTQIAVRKLDGLLTDVGFIKIDTEGYEKEILEGAKNLIAKHKPTICASAYHLKGDDVHIEKLIKQINEKYECRLINRGELDLFCK